jgi:hypothetical protein
MIITIPSLPGDSGAASSVLKYNIPVEYGPEAGVYAYIEPEGDD